MMAIKLYTDYDKLQYELKNCLRHHRQQSGRDSNNSNYSWDDRFTSRNSINDLSYLYWWRNIILICVSKFGIKMKKHKFFYGCRDKMELSNYGGFGLFIGPLSLTISLEVAKQYSTQKGMLMQIEMHIHG